MQKSLFFTLDFYRNKRYTYLCKILALCLGKFQQGAFHDESALQAQPLGQPQGFLFPKYSGEMTREGDRTVIVSRGLGTHTLNIRLFNMPELIVIRLKKTL